MAPGYKEFHPQNLSFEKANFFSLQLIHVLLSAAPTLILFIYLNLFLNWQEHFTVLCWILPYNSTIQP